MKKINEASKVATKQFSEIFKEMSNDIKRKKVFLLKRREEIIKDKNYGN